MDFKQLIAKRRSVRRYLDRKVERGVVERLLEATLTAPSSRNTHSTHLMVVEDAATIARMAELRDYGSAFLKGAPLAIVVLGEKSCNLWQVNCSISATMLQLACVDEGLASCWVHVEGRPRLQAEPDGEQASAYLRSLLSIPEGLEPLCVVAIGYSDFTPAPLPEWDKEAHILWHK